ncbi:hypothetical protein L6452_15195 [Arctium lappa]|uniref:Uncharacterized protein n=1 Tax=Arctium lappa TaxID=4217 RepID=A0ACB9CNP1_ARCLA|nr:hypothetical protein L6452_15195 [Arctium lappa]
MLSHLSSDHQLRSFPKLEVLDLRASEVLHRASVTLHRASVPHKGVSRPLLTQLDLCSINSYALSKVLVISSILKPHNDLRSSCPTELLPILTSTFLPWLLCVGYLSKSLSYGNSNCHARENRGRRTYSIVHRPS